MCNLHNPLNLKIEHEYCDVKECNGPIYGYGHKNATLIIVGACSGSGANRTTVPFLGDESGSFIQNLLIEISKNNQLVLSSSSLEEIETIEKEKLCKDDLINKKLCPKLQKCYITNWVKCFPKNGREENLKNKKQLEYNENFLKNELDLLKHKKLIIGIGDKSKKFLKKYFNLQESQEKILSSSSKFKHIPVIERYNNSNHRILFAKHPSKSNARYSSDIEKIKSGIINFILENKNILN